MGVCDEERKRQRRAGGGRGGGDGDAGEEGLGRPAHQHFQRPKRIHPLTLLPMLFVVGLWAWSYYVYVVLLIAQTIGNTVVQIVFAVFYHILSAMLLWSYFKAVFTRANAIPEKYHLDDNEMERLSEGLPCPELEERGLPIKTHDGNSDVRICRYCKLVKPDRCKHCRICGQCVLRYDHHCPWVANCVGYHNYKFFVLFVTYATLYLLYIGATTARYFILFVKGDIEFHPGMQLAAVCVVAGMFFITLIGLNLLHLRLVCQNKTTVEDMRREHHLVRDASFDLGHWKRNFYEVFGTEAWKWPLPIRSSLGDGCDYPLSHGEDTLQFNSNLHNLYNTQPQNDVEGDDEDERDGDAVPAQEVGEVLVLDGGNPEDSFLYDKGGRDSTGSLQNSVTRAKDMGSNKKASMQPEVAGNRSRLPTSEDREPLLS